MRLASRNYYGNTVVERRLNNFHLTLTSYKKEVSIPFHSHENPYLSMNMGCIYSEIEKKSKRVIQTGDVVFRRSCYEHSNLFSKDNGVCFNIEFLSFSDNKAEKILKQINLNQANLIFQKLIVANVNNYSDDELNCLIYETLNTESNSAFLGQFPGWYNIIIEYINEEYDNSISLYYLSNLTNVHPNYISRKFKTINGLNLSSYIRKVRLENAFNKLISNEGNLTKIGLDVGFFDQSHFTKSFRTIYGLNPSKFLSKYKRLISYN